MHKLVFKGEGLRKLIEWSEGREKRLPYTDTITKKMGLTLVKDDGIYVMASTTETFPKENGERGSFVVYAEGYDLNQDDLWEKTHEVSGDDFAEWIPLQPKMVSNLKHTKNPELIIKLSETQLEISAQEKAYGITHNKI